MHPTEPVLNNEQPTREPRLVQISDTHLLAAPDARMRGVDTRREFERLLAGAGPAVADAELLLLTGDLAEDGEAAAYRWLADRLEGCGTRRVALPGNHDAPALLADHFEAPLVAQGLALELGGWRLLLLDTTVAGESSGELSEARLAWLRRELRRDEQRPVLLAIHHPPLELGSPWIDAISLRDGETLHALLRDAGTVRGVLFGHAHQAFDRTRDGVRYLGCPSSCVQFTPGSEVPEVDDLAPGWRELTLRADGRIDTQVCRAE